MPEKLVELTAAIAVALGGKPESLPVFVQPTPDIPTRG
jgi:hypothetical protein